jgi:hypothetical protein
MIQATIDTPHDAEACDGSIDVAYSFPNDSFSTPQATELSLLELDVRVVNFIRKRLRTLSIADTT